MARLLEASSRYLSDLVIAKVAPAVPAARPEWLRTMARWSGLCKLCPTAAYLLYSKALTKAVSGEILRADAAHGKACICKSRLDISHMFAAAGFDGQVD